VFYPHAQPVIDEQFRAGHAVNWNGYHAL